MEYQGKILFMDNEPDEIESAVRRLKNEQYFVDQVESIEKATQLIKEKGQNYYDIFILDIDMDERDTDGVDLLNTLRRVSKHAKVIMYSARGKAPEWKRASNLHMFGYVHKSGEKRTPDVLCEMCQNAMAYTEDRSIFLTVSQRQKLQPPASVLLFHDGITSVSVDDLKQVILSTSPGAEVHIPGRLKEVKSLLQTGREKWGAVFLIAQEFPVAELSVMEDLKTILAFEGWPHILMACAIPSNANPDVILPLCNLRPFRLINLEENWQEEIQEGLKAALKWYRLREKLPGPEDYHMLKHQLDPELTSEEREKELEIEESILQKYKDETDYILKEEG